MKCKYCGKASVSDYCSEDCRNLCDGYDERVEKCKRIFYPSLIIPFLPLLIMFLGESYFGLSFLLVFVLLGAVVIVFPFATPETIGMWGVKKSVNAVRICGAVCIATGLIFYIWI